MKKANGITISGCILLASGAALLSFQKCGQMRGEVRKSAKSAPWFESLGVSIAVVANGKAMARVVTPSPRNNVTEESASLLVEYVRKSTGVTLETVDDTALASSELASIHIGSTKFVQKLNLDFGQMDKDGFVIAFPDSMNIILVGPSELSSRFAVLEFLEKYVGVRWLFPGTIGESVPALAALSVATDEVREEPAFYHRLFSGLNAEQWRWAEMNRLHERIQFHHNLWKVYLPEKYGATHPEFFPLINGARYIPRPAAGRTTANDETAQVGWQPDFSATGAFVTEAVQNIIGHFNQNPLADSFSLGVNDNGGYCTCDVCMLKDGGRNNELGMRHASQSYYSWVNAVANGVNLIFPKKIFGLLAYNGVYEPPSGFSLNPNVVPMMTYDRMKWVDPAREAAGHGLTEQWGNVSTTLGWYDYLYGGKFYLAPRVYFHQMAKYLRYGHQHKVRHYYAETYPSEDWHEGPKLYVALKLLWNPELDVAELLRDWYVVAVGAQAAPYLEKYFTLWEERWTKDVPKTAWFRGNGKQQYLDMQSHAYLSAFTLKDLEYCKELLQNAVHAALPGPQRDRAQYFLDGFMRRMPRLSAEIKLRNPTSVSVLSRMHKNAFDVDLEGWLSWQRDHSHAIFSRSDGGRNAPGSLRIDAANSQQSPLLFMQEIPVEHGKTYRASVWFRSEGLGEDAAVSIVINWTNGRNGWVSVDPAEIHEHAPFSDDWRQLTLYFEIGKNENWQAVKGAVVMLRLNQTSNGTVWFDDFAFDEVEIAN